MTKMSHRIFSLTMALVFIISAVAFSGFVIYQMQQDRKTADQQAALQKFQQEQQAKTQAEQQAKCPQGVPADALPAPEVFKPEGKTAELQTTDLEEGTGDAAKNGDCLVVKYYGTLASNGTLFDESFTKPTSFSFTLGQGSVIEGWEKGMLGMKAGGTRRLVIPAAQGYGSQSQAKIPADSDLVFVVKLLEIKKQ